MADYISEEEVKKQANELVDNVNKIAEERKGTFEAIMQEIEKIDPEMGGFEELAVMLQLPEDKFDIIAPIFLNELEKSYNNVNDKMSLVQALNANGLKVEDIKDQFDSISEQIDNTLDEVISPHKREFLKALLAMTYNAAAETEGIAKKTIMIPIEYCHPDAKMPAYAHLTDAGMDVYALEDITIAPGETKLIPIGIKVAIPAGYEIQVRAKSGRCLKTKLRVANAPGTIDAGYRDEIGVIIDNIDPPIRAIHPKEMQHDNNMTVTDNSLIGAIEYGSSYTIGKGEKFAQLVLNEVPKVLFHEVESVAMYGDDRGGGYGSTGLK